MLIAFPLQVVRISDGYQPHLVSPEAGLRKLVQESIEMVLDPVSTAVRRVHQVLLEVARCHPGIPIISTLAADHWNRLL